jgi:uncharacterized surface protein with fasciclin (FAS1) repeats
MIARLATSFHRLLRRHGLPVVGLLALALVLAGCDSQDLGDANPQTPSIAQIATDVPALSTLGDAVQQAGLDDELSGDGPLTVFAPLNEAFAPPIDPSSNPQVMERVLLNHVVSGAVPSTALSDGQTITPLGGGELTIGVGDAVTVNRATVTNPDVDASNGVVHVVDGLLIDAVDRATLTPQFSIFADLVGEAGLESVLRAVGANDGRTLFVPTNAALLDALDTSGNGQIESSEIPATASDILSYHVIDSVVLAADVPTTETAVETLQGADVTVVRDADSGAVTINPNDESASVVTPDVVVDNGVIHGIDTVLIP